MNLSRPLPQAPSSKVDFNAIPAPANYVPGLGRGATGFTTRSDIGPARMAPDLSGAAAGAAAAARKDDDNDMGDNQFDEFMGNDSGVLAMPMNGEYDEHDKEADEIWEAVDEFMDSRRRDRREKRLKEEIEKFRAENPKITEQFADLKRKLSEVKYDEWEGIPEIGDYTIKKQKRMQSFVPLPDTLLAKAAAEKQSAKSIDPLSGLSTPGLATPLGGASSTVSDLTAIGEGRGTVLELKLDRMADSVSGQTVVDPKGYLTDLKSMKINSDKDISDIKKARLLLKSVIQTNPHHAPGWIAAARLEEVAGKLQAARQLIQEGCERCPKSEDVWLEASRLHTQENAKAILARGVAQIPTSVKLWMAAARLETEDSAKARVLRKALERIPNSVRLWKAAVELASEEDARILLSRAVECCPQHVELWLALARLENYQNAQRILNKARIQIPTDPSIWITAAKLEESQGQPASRVETIIQKAIPALQKNRVVIQRESWLQEAQNAERASPPMVLTCRAIVKAVVGLGVEDEDRKRTFMADAEDCLKRGSVETARAIYAYALSQKGLSTKKGIWKAAAQLEKMHGTREGLEDVLKRAVQHCPGATILWLMAAKEKWLSGDVQGARAILADAFRANPDSVEIWLAAFKLEFENNEPDRARALLRKARDESSGASSSDRVWMKSAIVERELGDARQEREMLEEGLRRFPEAWKMWLMLGQLEERQGNTDAARAAYTSGLKRCMDCVPLWKSAAHLEERAGQVTKARAILEQARLKNPKNDLLWLAAIRTEQRGNNTKAAETLLAKALQDCPSSGPLWAEAIAMAPRPQRKTKSTDALKRCDNDPHIIAAVAQLFWNDRKVDKARTWFNRAVTLMPDYGDFWALFYKFECTHGSPEQQKAVLDHCVTAEPHHGERWCRVSKNPANAHMNTETILKKVVHDLDSLPPP